MMCDSHEDTKPGPIAVKLEAGKTYYYCTCGASKTQPFCDGSHKTGDHGGKRSLAFTAERDETVWLCGCKHTGKPPFCNGAHRYL